MRLTLRLLIVALLLWSGWACTDTLVNVVDVAVLEIEPDDVELTPGQSQQLQARVRDAQGNILSGRSIQWSSNAEGVASVGPNGMVLGVSTGSARITATSEGVQGTADVAVAAAPLILAQPDSVPLEAVIDETETATATIAITNGGGGTIAGLDAAIEYDSSAGDWLDAELSGPAAPATLTVTADADGLARGTYRASVRLTSTSIGADPIVVRVVLAVLQRTPAPTLVSVTPNQSAREQSLDVIMTGSGFVPGLTTVSFGSGITVSNVNVEGPTTLTASITVGTTAAVGTRTVSVINPAPGGGTASIANAFTVEGLNPRPTITSVDPATAQRQSTLDVTLVGTGFLDDVTRLDFGIGITINSIDVTSATVLTANITIGAGAALGSRDITVTNPAPGGGVGTLRDAFTVTAANPAPTLTSVSPGSAQRLETITVQLTGGNFATGLTTIDFGPGITVSGMTVASASTITAGITIDAAAALGARAVRVTNAGPGGGTATLANGFTVLDANPAPVVQSIAPASGRLAQTLDVVVTGTGFVDGVTIIAFGAGITVNTTSVTDATSLTANISVAGDAALGLRSITATNAAPGGGTDTLPDAFTVFGAVSADLSTVTAAPSTNVAANDTAVSTVTVVVRDAASGAVTGLAPAAFALSVSGSATIGAIAETAMPGTYRFTVSNTVAETVTVNVTADGVALDDAPTIAFVATVVSAANSSVSADPLTGVTADGVDASLVTVVLRDANDNAIGGLAETAFDIDVGDNATASAITETATAGTYTFTVMNTVAETVTVSVSAGGTTLNEAPVITFVPGAGSAAHSGATVPAGTAGAVTPISITVQDASGNPVTGAASALAVSITGANTASPAVTDNGDGTYSATYTPTVAGGDNVAITLGGVAIAGSPFTSDVSAGAISAAVSGVTAAPSTVVANGTAAATVTVTLRDAHDNPIGDVAATDFELNVTGSGTPGTPSETATPGTYTFAVTNLAAQTVTVTVEVRGVTLDDKPTIQFTPGAPTQIAVNGGNGQSQTAGQPVPFSPSVIVRDASGHPLTGVGVTFAVTGGGGGLAASGSVVTGADGIATSPVWTLGTTAGENTLTATSGSLPPVVFTATGVAGAAARLTTTTQPSATAASGAAFAQQPAIQLRDVNNNAVAQAGTIVTAGLASGGVTLGGTLTATTNAAGLATFENLSITGTVGARTLSFTSGALTAATSNAINITAGAATQIAVNGGNNQSATVGTAVAVAPSVLVRDASLNSVAGVSVTFAVASGGGSLGASGVVTTNASGIATSPAWTLGPATGANTLTATSAGLTGSPVTFTATGTAGAASQLTITTQPSATAVSGAAFAQQPAIQLRDANSNPVAQAGTIVTAGLASGGVTLGGMLTATTDAAGLARFTSLSITGLTGERTLSFASGALAAATSSAINITAGAATQIAVNGGNNQSATVGTAVAVAPSVLVRDASLNPVAGVSVTFAVASGGGSLAASGIVTTNASGIATSPAWTLGTTAGVNTLTATSAGLIGSPVQFTATGTAGAATQLTITTQPSATAASGTTFAQQPAIQLRDASGNTVAQAGTVVTAAIASGGVTLGGTLTATTNAAGLATFTDLVITGLIGERTLSFTSGALTVATSSGINITAGAATQIAVNGGNNQSATAGTAVAVAPSVLVRDASLNAVAGVSVTFAVASGGGSLAASGIVTTNASGIATSPAWTLGANAGPNTLTATSAGLTGSPVTFTATGTAGAASQLTITTQPSATAVSGTAFAQQPSIQLLDGSGNDVAQAGTIVTTAIASGGATLGGTLTATTNAAGLATFTNLTITGLTGERTLTFTSGALAAATSSAINITAGAATQIAVNGGNNQSATVGTAVAVAPSVLVRDASLNPVAGVSVTFAVASGGGSLATNDPVITNASGIATSPAWTLGANAGPNTLTATSGSLSGSPMTFTATGTAGAASQLTIRAQPSATAVSGTAFAQQPAIQLLDASGNTVAQAGTIVTAAIASGSVTLGGTLTATTNAAGLATFTDVVITGLIGERTLSFTSGALTVATSSGINITAGAATQIAVNGGNNQSATVGTAVTTAPSVIVTDTGGNPIAGVSVTFAVASGDGSLATTDPVVTDGAGIAASPTWTLGPVEGPNTLTATAAGLTGSPVTFTATGTTP